jgi:dUTP pyrophosphatase
MNQLDTKIVLLDPELKLEYATPGSAAFDVRSVEETFRLYPGEQKLVRLGFKIAVPPGYAGFLLPRSGGALVHQLTLGNCVGLIDPDYRGEVKAILRFYGEEDRGVVEVEKYDRIGQFIVMPVAQCRFQFVESLDETVRGEGGFGSSGVA